METQVIAQEEKAGAKQRMFALALATAGALLSSAAFAQANGMETAVTMIYDEAYSTVPALGTLALIVVGISAMFGRISVTQALVVAVGIAIAADPDYVLNLVK